MSQLRRCKVTGNGEDRPGIFHDWGNSTQLDDNGKTHSITIAIVELDNGRVIEVEPHRVTFI